MANRQAEEPLRIADADAVRWHESADVIVVGFGGAGAAAAIQASEEGASVIAVDRFEGGGATAYSGGVFYAGGTRYLKAAGYEDTADEMYRYLEKEGLVEAVGPATLRRFCDGSNDDIEWAARLGVPYGGKAFEEKTSYPPDGYYLYYTGNEKMPAFKAVARPAPRGHRVAVNGFGGELYFRKLKEGAQARGVRLIPHAPVTRLVLDSRNTVIGVEINELPESLKEQHQKLYKVLHPWKPFNSRKAEKAAQSAAALEEQHPQKRLLRAKKGVILSTGGYNHNAEMFERFHPLLAKHYHKLLRLGSMGDDGSGIKLGLSAGAALERTDYIGIARTMMPPDIFAYGILVNQNGERFFNEAAYAMRIGVALMDQPDGKAWLILNGPDFWAGLKASFLTGANFLIWGLPALVNIFLGGTRRAATLTGLAKRIHVDPTGLSKTAADFNAMAVGGRQDPHGKAADLLQPIQRGPFYAVNFSIDNGFAPSQIMTTGGLAVDGETGMVKRADESTIHGLYAAGRAAAGIVSNGFVSGLTIADTVFSGRRAARAIVNTKVPNVSAENEAVENEAVALSYYKRLYSCECASAVSANLSDDYVEHQYTARFSKEGLLDYVRGRLESNTAHHMVVHKAICEGNSVFLLVEEKLDGGISVARAELFRLARGKVAEHWGSHVVDEKSRKNTNGTFDGPQPNRNLDYARRFVERFEALDLRAFDKQEFECFYESRTLDYKQHSPKGGDGLEGLVGILRKMKADGQKMIMQPKRVICDGDFIVCHRLYDSFPKHPLVNRINTFDLFRLNAEGKAVEHWDVMEDVPTEDMLAKVF